MRSSKRFIDDVVTLAIVAGMALPYGAGAQSGFDVTRAPRTDRVGFCKALDGVTQKLEEHLASAMSSVAAKRAETQLRLVEGKAAHEARLEELRAAEDEKRVERIGGLESIADTDAERLAIAKFQADVADAIDARRGATDRASEAFRDGLKSTIADRVAAVDLATVEFNVAVRAAVAKAAQECASGVAPKDVRAALVASLEASRGKLQAELKTIAKLGLRVKARVDARNAAHRKAMMEFRTALDVAKFELQAAFGV